MDSTRKRRKEDPPPGLFTLHLRHGGRIIKTLPAQYIGGEVSTFNNMEEDEWGLVSLKEKVSEIGLGMDEGFRYFTLTAKGLQELLQDCEVWDLVNQCNSPKVIEIWIVKGIVGADCSNDGSGEEVDGTEEEYDGSGEELDGSEEEYDGSGDEIDGSGEDDADFVNNTDMNAEYGGLGDLEVQNQDNDFSRATVCEEVNYSDEGSLCGSDGEIEGRKLPTFLKEVEEEFRNWEATSASQGKPKSLWEELAEIGEEFVEFLEKELNITDPDAEEEKAQNNNAYSGAEGMGSGTQNKATDKRNNIEENLDDIEAALAQLKKELGL
nr:dnaJ homolog subfamily B member 9 isoform X2 [Ipomoea trifida]